MIRHPRNAGFGLMEILVASGLIAIVLVGMNKMFSGIFKSQKQATTVASMLEVSRNIQNQINSSKNWAKTLANSTNASAFSCLKNSPYDCASLKSTDTPFVLYNEFDNVIHDVVSNPTAGFTNNGQPCTGFSASGSDTCPFQLQLTWTPSACPSSGACTSPVPKVDGRFVYKPATASRSLAFNSTNYDFSIIGPGAGANANNGGGGGGGGTPPSGGGGIPLPNDGPLPAGTYFTVNTSIGQYNSSGSSNMPAICPSASSLPLGCVVPSGKVVLITNTQVTGAQGNSCVINGATVSTTFSVGGRYPYAFGPGEVFSLNGNCSFSGQVVNQSDYPYQLGKFFRANTSVGQYSSSGSSNMPAVCPSASSLPLGCVVPSGKRLVIYNSQPNGSIGNNCVLGAATIALYRPVGIAWVVVSNPYPYIFQAGNTFTLNGNCSFSGYLYDE